MYSRKTYRTKRTYHENESPFSSLSFRKALCHAAYAYHRRRKAQQIKRSIRKTHRNCVNALRELTACHLDNKKHVIVRAKIKYEKAVYAHRRCAHIITQCSTKYHSKSDRKWLKNVVEMHAGYAVALQYVKCIVCDKLEPVQRSYYACKGIKFMKLYLGML